MFLDLPSLKKWRDEQLFRVISATNGCFDVLHIGHVRLLNRAKLSGDFLVVGINSDEAVRKLKGPSRPFNNEQDRSEVLQSLRCVDIVTIFNSDTCEEFLEILRPTHYWKSTDYSLDTLNQKEKTVLNKCLTQIHFYPFQQGHSSSKLIASMK
jgi:rfaE bifunctional protein nucleotidyltransferase chain/domain